MVSQSHRVTLQLNALELAVEQTFVVAILDMAQSVMAAAPAQERLLKQSANNSSNHSNDKGKNDHVLALCIYTLEP